MKCIASRTQCYIVVEERIPVPTDHRQYPLASALNLVQDSLLEAYCQIFAPYHSAYTGYIWDTYTALAKQRNCGQERSV